MKIGIAVYSDGLSSPASHSALMFAKAALTQGHKISRVFFYHEGAHVANTLSVTPQDEPNLQNQWRELHYSHGIELGICIATALRRGIVNQSEQLRHNLKSYNLDDAFDLIGLGQLADMAITSDRFITFDS